MIEVELTYEHDGRIYKIKTEKTHDTYVITFNEANYTVEALELKPGYLRMKLGDKIIKAVISEGHESKFIFLDGNVFNIRYALPKSKRIDHKEEFLSPISGKVVDVRVKEGDEVKKGDILMVIEAMKMEYLIKAPYAGMIEKINFTIDEQIDMGVKPVDIKKLRK